jgi:endonuclease/exonuclease/phosphatase (EEP) superfamily protein YafD
MTIIWNRALTVRPRDRTIQKSATTKRHRYGPMNIITVKLESLGVPNIGQGREKELIEKLRKALKDTPPKVIYEDGAITIRSNTDSPPKRDQVNKARDALKRLLEEWNESCAGIGFYTIQEHPELEDKRVLAAEQQRIAEELREAELAESRKHGHVPNTWKKTAAGVSGWTDEELHDSAQRYGKVLPPADPKPAERPTRAIKAVTWNTAGNNAARDKHTVEADLRDHLGKGEYDVILLQECPLGVSINNYTCVAHSAPFATTERTTCNLVFIKSQLEKAVPQSTYRPPWDSSMLIAYYYSQFLGSVGFLSMHMRSTATPTTKKRNIVKLFDELEVRGPLFIGGDFNFEPRELDGWQQLFSSGPTHRMGLGKPDATHDFFIISTPLVQFYDINVDVLSIKTGSDHDPVTLSLKLNQ